MTASEKPRATPRVAPHDIMLETFCFRETDARPHNLYLHMISEDVRNRLDAHYGGPEWIERITQYIYGSMWCGGQRTDIGGGMERDSFGSVFRKGNVTHRYKIPLKTPSLSGYMWPKPESLADWDDLAAKYKDNSHSFRLNGVAYGYFERSMFLRGFENIMVDMEDHPGFVHELLDAYLELRLKAYQLMCQRLEFDAIFGGGDDCDNRGPMMGLERWRKFIKPRLKREIQQAHDLGKPYICHECGNVMPILDDLLEIGIDALDPLQPEPMDIYTLKKKVSGRLVLFGGMGSQSTLPFGTPVSVKAETERLMREMGLGGGYIIQPAKPIRDEVPTENAVAFIETALAATNNI